MTFLTKGSNFPIQYTEYERNELKKQRDMFYSMINKLSDGSFFYNKYFLPINHFESSVFYYKHGIDLINKERIKNKTIIDVGGFIGDSVLVLSELEPETIVTFEADPNNYRLIEKTLGMNELDVAVVAENIALGDKEGTMSLKSHGSCTSCIFASLSDKDETIEIAMTTLDKYVEKNNIDNIGLIKVDIEGAEPLFLEGAKNVIKTQRPTILLSIYHNAHDFFELKPFLENLLDDYLFRIHRPPLSIPTVEILLIAEPNSVRD